LKKVKEWKMLTFGGVGRLPRVLHLSTTEKMDQNTTIAKKEKTRSADRDKPWLQLASKPEGGGGGRASERDEEWPEKRERRGGAEGRLYTGREEP
jgi:hypothetical protein